MMPKSWMILVFVLFTWILSSIIAAVPVSDVFRSHVPDTVLLMDNPFLEQSVLNLTTGKQYLLQLLVFYPSQDSELLHSLAEQAQNSQTWDSLLRIYETFPEQHNELQIAARYG